MTTRFFDAPPLCEREILRYAGCKEADPTLRTLMNECLAEMGDKLSYKVCYHELPVSINGTTCDFNLFAVESAGLAKNLSGCTKAILFAATIGVEIDRLIARYGRVSPSKAVLFQAIGAERIESLCDAFCATLGETRPRFSPGYGDLSLAVQKDLIAVLDAPKQIGVGLNDSLLLSPSKSVTAFVGLGAGEQPPHKCSLCNKTDCAFRGV